MLNLTTKTAVVNKQEFFKIYKFFEKDILIEIIDIFIHEAPEKIESLYNDMNSNNLINFHFNAHSLKGTIGNFCAPVAFQMAKDLEKTSNLLLEIKKDKISDNIMNSKILEITGSEKFLNNDNETDLNVQINELEKSLEAQLKEISDAIKVMSLQLNEIREELIGKA